MWCLSTGEYKFVITDLFKDGLCCSFGQGKYTGYLDSKVILSSPSGDQDWEKRAHKFTVSMSSNTPQPTRKPTNKPTSKPVLPFQPKINDDMAARDTGMYNNMFLHVN